MDNQIPNTSPQSKLPLTLFIVIGAILVLLTLGFVSIFSYRLLNKPQPTPEVATNQLQNLPAVPVDPRLPVVSSSSVDYTFKNVLIKNLSKLRSNYIFTIFSDNPTLEIKDVILTTNARIEQISANGASQSATIEDAEGKNTYVKAKFDLLNKKWTATYISIVEKGVSMGRIQKN